MRIRAGWGLLICCAVLTACTANAPKGPAATVTTPAVGRPPAPASAQAALGSQVFTPYAALGASNNDGLAPGDTYDVLHTACMNDAGYGQYAADAPYPARTNRGLGFPQAFGPWGYVGTALAAQEGFLAGSGGPGGGVPVGGPFASLPTAAQAAAGKCFNIMENFNNAQFAHSMSIIETLNNYISTDVVQDGEFKKADRNWSACMAKNGFSSPDAEAFWSQALNSIEGGTRDTAWLPATGSGPSGHGRQAVADHDSPGAAGPCSGWLAGPTCPDRPRPATVAGTATRPSPHPVTPDGHKRCREVVVPVITAAPPGP